MSDVLRALGISAGILLTVVVFIVIISIAVVRRGEGDHIEADRHVPDDPLHAKETAPAAKTLKPAGPVVEEVSVPHILLFGIGLFTLTIVVLLALSLIEHLR